MKKLIVLLIFAVSILSYSQSTDFDVVNLFYQGKANNCASIALIKAAMIKYGYKEIFKIVKLDGEYSIKLRDNSNLVITQSEYDLAKKYSNFETNESNLSSE
jgi:hypothetical protein